mmetsp:Transcript_71062/g.183250  ORF Transcript_71062/g.183250 Transcript_71062/m.183250 type:complete len:331 (-) Transcript_71062:102-1094(-)
MLPQGRLDVVLERARAAKPNIHGGDQDIPVAGDRFFGQGVHMPIAAAGGLCVLDAECPQLALQVPEGLHLRPNAPIGGDGDQHKAEEDSGKLLGTHRRVRRLRHVREGLQHYKGSVHKQAQQRLGGVSQRPHGDLGHVGVGPAQLQACRELYDAPESGEVAGVPQDDDPPGSAEEVAYALDAVALGLGIDLIDACLVQKHHLPTWPDKHGEEQGDEAASYGEGDVVLNLCGQLQRAGQSAQHGCRQPNENAGLPPVLQAEHQVLGECWRLPTVGQEGVEDLDLPTVPVAVGHGALQHAARVLQELLQGNATQPARPPQRHVGELAGTRPI